jgi:hypothetical protein
MLGERESASMSTTWKVGVREVSRPYLCVSTIDPWAGGVLYSLRLKLFMYDHLPLLFGARLSRKRHRASSLRGLPRSVLRHG